WSISHSFFAYMGGFMLYHGGKPCCTITPPNLRALISDKTIDPIALTRSEINDSSKGNVISKGLVMLQVAWFIINLSARRYYDIPISPLEIGTMAFAMLCVITYLFWWYKPLNVRHPRRVEWRGKNEPPKDLYIDEYVFPRILMQVQAESETCAVSTKRTNSVDTSGKPSTFGGDDVGTHETESNHAEFNTVLAIGFLAAVAFGLVHLTAWWLQFPSYAERLIWHISVIVVISTPPCTLLNVLLLSVIYSIAVARGVESTDTFKTALKYVTVGTYGIIGLAYVVARLAIIVIMFTSLRDLTPGSYETVEWSDLIPHV
ncbi:hypothetical protein CONPUDRAFT_64775, partial [Coniophora puteana RWD-64-598 SS2]